MDYKLSRPSINELKGVHPDLVAVVKRAIEITEVDFGVHDGLRTHAEQTAYVKRGVSKTMNSKHMKQSDGLGHAVDLVPYINGKLRWEWEAIYPIAVAVRQAAKELGVKIRWGGTWDRLDTTATAPRTQVEKYVDARRKAGKSAFIDGPHYELV